MTTEMAPPAPRNSTSSTPKNSKPPQPDPSPESQPERHVANAPEPARPEPDQNRAVPYTIPEWSGAPCHRYTLEVLKDGSIVDHLHVYEKGAYMFGRVDLCDFVLEHPTISRFHAVLQYKRNGIAYIHDLGSTHGTFVNKNQVKKKVFVELHVGDVIRFGQSSRLYILQGPSELMPPESDLKRIKKAKQRVEMEDMEASLLRAKVEAARADGISWGMGEDAIEENEDDVDEITWQTYRGQLTENQEKTREKVLKRLEKITHMKKEMGAIRAKDISQGGLTQGQQTQIARNEQRIEQIMEELESLEETLNESIRESLGARGGKMHGKKKGFAEDEEEYMSDDDDFYDRTKKRTSNRKGGENQSVETAETLLHKRDAIVKEMEEKKELFINERDKMSSGNEGLADAGDELDAFMSGLSSQLVLDKVEKHEKEMSTLQTELDRILYLLKIADPSEEAAKKRESKSQDIKSNEPINHNSSSLKKISPKSTKPKTEKSSSNSVEKEVNVDTKTESNKMVEAEEAVDKTEEKKTTYAIVKPQWLGAVDNMETNETKPEAPQAIDETDQFVDYKDRNSVLKSQDTPKDDVALEIENAAPGLIVRKRKQVEKTNTVESKASEESTFSAQDAIALLLKHEKGYYASEEGDGDNVDDMSNVGHSGKDSKKAKKAIGPERPPFLKKESVLETWVPPKGQSGDGRTSLNDRFGY